MILCVIILGLSAGVRVLGWKYLPDIGKRGLLILMAAALLGLLEGIVEYQDQTLINGNMLARNENGGGSYEEELEFSAGDLFEKESYSLEVKEQRLTEEEQREYLTAALEEIRDEFLDQNESPDCVRGHVKIRDSYQQGRVKAEWYFDNYRIMDFEGNVTGEMPDEKGELVCAQVELECQDSKCMEEFCFQVFPEEADDRKQFLNRLEKELTSQEEMSGTEYIKLPDKIGQYQVSWREKKSYTPEKMVLLGVVLVCMLPLLKQSRDREQKKKLAQQMLLEYPNVVSKLALLLGAGMTPFGAWNKIAHIYDKKRQNNTISWNPVYEEMLVTCREMESGVGEERAYERFGERCGIPCYRRLGNVLSQNLRKGSREITSLLEREAAEAFEERKSAARKMGEEAGTKMLLPMMVMLGIVMMILIVPAVFAFQM